MPNLSKEAYSVFDRKKGAPYSISTLILCWLLGPFIGAMTIWLFLVVVLAPAAYLGKWH